MTNQKQSPTRTRTVVANISLSLDGRVTGPAGEYDMGWIVPHAITDGARDHMIHVTSPATTVLLGRKNYEGFGSYWPTLAHYETADPRDRTFAQWLNFVEKIVFSSRISEATWENSRRLNEDPAAGWRRYYCARQRQHHQAPARSRCPGPSEHHTLP